MSLPTELLYEIFGHVDDKATIDSALEVVPDIVHSAVRRIHSPRVVQVRPEYLTAFTRLERTTNILVSVPHSRIYELHALSHLRGLCVGVFNTPDPMYTLERLKQIFRVEDKRDDQLFVFKATTRAGVSRDAYFHNNTCTSTYPELAQGGFAYMDFYYLAPRPFYDLLRSVRPYADGDLLRVLDIIKYKYIGHELFNPRPIAKWIGMQKFAELVNVHMRAFIVSSALYRVTDPVMAVAKSISGGHIPWHQLHYYDIPDRAPEITAEEKRIMDDYDTSDDDA